MISYSGLVQVPRLTRHVKTPDKVKTEAMGQLGQAPSIGLGNQKLLNPLSHRYLNTSRSPAEPGF